MTSYYFQIGVLLALLCLLAGTTFIWSKVHYLIKVVLAIVVMAVSIYVWSLAGNALGYPVKAYPPNGAVLISVDSDKDGDLIYLWVKEPSGCRAYAVPYSDDLFKRLSDARELSSRIHGRMVLNIARGPLAGSYDPFGHDDRIVKIDVVPSFPEKDIPGGYRQ